MKLEQTVEIPDVEVPGKSIKVRITVAKDGIVLHPEGTGVYDSPESGPVLLELHKGSLQLQVWSDIEDADPQTINLDGARLENKSQGIEISVISKNWISAQIKSFIEYARRMKFPYPSNTADIIEAYILADGPTGNHVKIDNIMVHSMNEAIAQARWGTHGISGKDEVKWVRLGDCSTAHLKAILGSQKQITADYRAIITEIITRRNL